MLSQLADNFPLEMNTPPKNVNFLITTRCNQRCKFCLGSFSGANEDSKLAKRTLRRGIKTRHVDGDPDSIKRMTWLKSVKAIKIAGSGEALAHPRYYDFVKNVREMSPNASLGYYGNGFGFHGKKLDITLRNMDNIHISLNAVRKETFNKIIDVGSHKHTMLGLKKISEFKRRNPNRLRVALSFVLVKENVYETKLFIDFAAKMGFESVSARLGLPPGHDLLPADSYLKNLDEYIDVPELTKYASERGVMFSTNDAYRASLKMRICQAPWSTLYFSPNEKGWEIGACCRGDIGVVLPYDKGEDFSEFYNHSRMQFLRATVNDHEKILANKMCLKCRMTYNNLEKIMQNESFYSKILDYQLFKDEIVL